MFESLKRLFTVIDTKEDAIQLQEEFLRALEKAYTTYSAKPVRKYLHKNVHYHSFYVMQELHSKDAYLSYLYKKLTAMMVAKKEYRFVMMEYHGGYPYLMITNQKDEQKSYFGFYVKNDEWGKITEIGMMPASMMRGVHYKSEEDQRKVEQEQ